MDLKVGDIVSRKSYQNDVFFKVEEIVGENTEGSRARLRGLDVRLYADSPVEDLVKADPSELHAYRRRFIKQNNDCLKRIFARKQKLGEAVMTQKEEKLQEDFFELPGRVLHIDGNKEYLNLCMGIYRQLGVAAEGIHIPEAQQPAFVPGLVEKYRPDILVLTGHDGIIKSGRDLSDIGNYHNSSYFVEGVKGARRVESNKDNLIIFAGACQSHYESILAAGANFASSPTRVFIHAFDPVFLVDKVAFTPISEIVSIQDAIDNTITGTEGLGGLETRGKYRKGYPKIRY